MFAAQSEFTITDHLESYLAQWTGKSSWPFVEARMESRLVVPAGDQTKRSHYATRYEVFTYEVAEVLYTASVRLTAGYQEQAQAGDRVMLQYNPVDPAASYYAPTCVLANRFVTLLVMLAGVAAMALAVSGTLEQR